MHYKVDLALLDWANSTSAGRNNRMSMKSLEAAFRVSLRL